MAEETKRILDSVHGYVLIPTMYVDHIIDTVYFQRLRRIEQTSCRALFPSARHDRFIHSIGVFFLGTKICEHLWKDVFTDEEKHNNQLISIIITYRLACLLHDVGHTPFSHTFEGFFDHTSNDLIKKLANLMPEDPDFEKDFISQFTDEGILRFAPHEVLSAFVALTYFREIIESPENQWKGNLASGVSSLLARMIVGCRYNTDDKSMEDAFIELLHSDIIDADGLDYVCRDVWASGYSTSKVDVSRLIDAILILRNNGKYVVCYNGKALNEIKSVLQVKNFQNDFVFNHHTVILEQELLKQAMMSAAINCLHISSQEGETLKDMRERALNSLCDIEMYYPDGFRIPTGETIKTPMDDDFIHLMKMIPNDVYVSQWFSRQYNSIPLWKRQDEFLADLSDELRKDFYEKAWIFSDACKTFLADVCETSTENIRVLTIKPKDRQEKLNKALIYTNGQICEYTKFFPTLKQQTRTKEEKEFVDKATKMGHPLICFVLIPKEKESERRDIQIALIEEWKKNVREDE